MMYRQTTQHLGDIWGNGMILVIFGASASYDSVPTRPPVRGLSLLPRLPLAEGLFSDRKLVAKALSKFPECLPNCLLSSVSPTWGYHRTCAGDSRERG